jgi:hypothetical protein
MCIYHELTNEQQTTLQAIFVDPPRSDISWSDILSLLQAIAEMSNGQVWHSEDRVCIALGRRSELVGVFHRLNETGYASPYTIKEIRRLLTE